MGPTHETKVATTFHFILMGRLERTAAPPELQMNDVQNRVTFNCNNRYWKKPSKSNATSRQSLLPISLPTMWSVPILLVRNRCDYGLDSTSAINIRLTASTAARHIAVIGWVASMHIASPGG